MALIKQEAGVIFNKLKKILGINESTTPKPSTNSERSFERDFAGNGEFRETVQRVVRMTEDVRFCDRVRKLGLNVINVMWEDTARTPGSVWGPNISDMTLQVRHPDSSQHRDLLPVIRYPNFLDKTGDVSLDLVKMKVGNEKGEEPEVVTLREYLMNLKQYISHPAKFHRENQPLVTERDSHVLISAQACFLPIPRDGKCSFNPVLFNYQSRQDNPAVLAVLITTEGSSATVIDNTNDKASWGQNIYFNNNGQKTCLTGERLSDFSEKQALEMAEQEGISLQEARSQVNVAQDVNMVMIAQVPLKHEAPEYQPATTGALGLEMASHIFAAEVSDMEDAVIGHGEDEGEHLELGGHKLERDERYPIRVTVQFYKATSNGIIDDEDLKNISRCIGSAYESADYIGSLVVGTLEKGDLKMGEARPTQPAPDKKAVEGPPKDLLEVVDPFQPHQKPKAKEKEEL